jgi:spore germination protein YaaH
MNLTEYKEKALRTESKIDNININLDEFKKILEIFVLVSEMLDCYKKKIFYKNNSKYDTRMQDFRFRLEELAHETITSSKTGIDSQVSINSRLLHGILGTATESGELINALIKYIQTGSYDKINIQEESGAGDIAWYTAILMDELNLSWEQGLINNINKLKVRFPDKYSDDLASNRNLDAERQELEKK